MTVFSKRSVFCFVQIQLLITGLFLVNNMRRTKREKKKKKNSPLASEAKHFPPNPLLPSILAPPSLSLSSSSSPEMSYPTFHVHPPFPVSARKKEDDGGGGGGKKEAAAAAMRRLAEMDHRAAADGGKVVVAVAVDGDRGSQHALKWAADHVLSRSHPFFLLHVRRKHASLHSAGTILLPPQLTHLNPRN